MFTVEEVCEEQERQYNQLMQEDDQYCHPESFKWGFEHGFEYALSKFDWIPVEEELPKHKVEDNGLITYEEVLVCLNDGYVTTDCYDDTRKKWLGYNDDVEYWMPMPPAPRKEENDD